MIAPGTGRVHDERRRQFIAVVQRHALHTSAAEADTGHPAPELHVHAGFSAGADEIAHRGHRVDVPALDLEEIATAALAIVSLAGLEIGRQCAGVQRREAFREVGVVQDLGRNPETLHPPMLCVGPFAVAARHPQHPVLVELRGRFGEPGECMPVPVGVDPVAREQERLVNGIAHAAYGGRCARGALTDARAFLDNGDAEFRSARQLPGDGQADDACACNDHVVAFHLSFAGSSWPPEQRPGSSNGQAT